MSFLPSNVVIRQTRIASAVLALALSSVMSFNAAAGLFDDDEARKDIKALRAQVEQQNRDNDLRMQKLDESIKNIGILQLLNQIEQLNAELARLRGQVEVLTNQNEQLAKRQKDFYLDIDSRLRKLEGVGDAPPTVNVQPATVPAGIKGLAGPSANNGAGLANAVPTMASGGLPGSPAGLAAGGPSPPIPRLSPTAYPPARNPQSSRVHRRVHLRPWLDPSRPAWRPPSTRASKKIEPTMWALICSVVTTTLAPSARLKHFQKIFRAVSWWRTRNTGLALLISI